MSWVVKIGGLYVRNEKLWFSATLLTPGLDCAWRFEHRKEAEHCAGRLYGTRARVVKLVKRSAVGWVVKLGGLHCTSPNSSWGPLFGAKPNAIIFRSLRRARAVRDACKPKKAGVFKLVKASKA